MPQAVAAGQHAVTNLEPVDAAVCQGRVLVRAEAARQQVRLRVHVGFVFSDRTFVDQPLHIRVVDAAADHVGAAKVVNARIAGMHDVAFARRADEESGHGAVRFFFGSDRGQLDHEVRLEHQLFQRFGGVVAARRVALEQLVGREQHLIGGLAAATLAAHAVGQHREQATGCAVVRDDLDLVLLIGAVATMQARGGGKSVTEGGCAHGRKL